MARVKLARPLCVNCGKPLRSCKHRDAYPQLSPFGDYGDGHFCGLNCGYRWAVMYLRKHADYATRLHASMIDVMAKKGAHNGEA